MQTPEHVVTMKEAGNIACSNIKVRSIAHKDSTGNYARGKFESKRAKGKQ